MEKIKYFLKILPDIFIWTVNTYLTIIKIYRSNQFRSHRKYVPELVKINFLFGKKKTNPYLCPVFSKYIFYYAKIS